jgi:putative tryptophan/tyrosine transport system substrate-binding protein
VLRRDRSRVCPPKGRRHCHIGWGGRRGKTGHIPIVYAVANDPLSTGLIASLARPGANVTGLSNQANDLAAKRLELLR